MTLELMEWPCKYLPSPDLPVTIDQRGARVSISGIDTTVLPSTPFKVIPSTLTGFLHPSDARETEIVPTSEHTIMLKHLLFFKGFCKFKLYTPLSILTLKTLLFLQLSTKLWKGHHLCNIPRKPLLRYPSETWYFSMNCTKLYKAKTHSGLHNGRSEMFKHHTIHLQEKNQLADETRNLEWCDLLRKVPFWGL